MDGNVHVVRSYLVLGVHDVEISLTVSAVEILYVAVTRLLRG